MSVPGPDRFASARAVADAVLYEGYVLYPYRAVISQEPGSLAVRSAHTSRLQRGGRLRTMVDADRVPRVGSGPSDPVLSVRIRCLQVQHRGVEAAVTPTSGDDEPEFAATDVLRVGGELVCGLGRSG